MWTNLIHSKKSLFPVLLLIILCSCQPSVGKNLFLDPVTQSLLSTIESNSGNLILSLNRSIAKPGDTVRLTTNQPLASLGGLSLFLDSDKGEVPFHSSENRGVGSYDLKIKSDLATGIYTFPIQERLTSLQRNISPNTLTLEIDSSPPSLAFEFEGKFDATELSQGYIKVDLSEEIETLPEASQIRISGNARNTLVVSQVLRSNTKSWKLLLNGTPAFEGGKIEFQFPTLVDKAGNQAETPTLTSSIFGFRPTSSMNTPRRACAAVELLDGRGLVTGGTQNTVAGQLNILQSTEFYDPIAKSFSFGPSFNVGRREHQITLLPNGEVFVSGGWGPQVPGTQTPNIGLFSTEIFNPALNQWRLGPNLKVSRERHAQLLLSDGTILISGGNNSTPLATAEAKTIERVNLSTGTSTVVATMSEPRREHIQVLLKDGRVLIAGGEVSPSVATGSMEVLDPTTNQLTPLTSTIEPRIGALSYQLSNGNILVLGGFRRTSPTEQPVFSIEMIEFPSLTVKRLSNINLGRIEGNSFLFPFGKDRFNISGGRERTAFYDSALPNSEVWNPVTELSTIASSNISGRINACSYTYSKGGGMAIGGRIATILRSAEEYTSE